VVKLDGSFLDRDLILYAQVAEPHQPRLIYEVPLILLDFVFQLLIDFILNFCLLLVKKSEAGSRALMLSLVPWCSLKAAEQKVELIFLVDRSGSMEGKGIQQAKRALKVRNGNPAFLPFN
jgi:von Willebrand factor A domain-containing protein 5